MQDFDAQQFLDSDWQRQPRLLRAALPAFVCPVDGDDLAGLACEADVDSRLIRRDGEDWLLRHGPLDESDFAELPACDWTLLVQSVDHWIPEVAALLEHFRFLPRWRIDDIMISYASDGGSVGPHYDNYDVFLGKIIAVIDGPAAGAVIKAAAMDPEHDRTLFFVNARCPHIQEQAVFVGQFQFSLIGVCGLQLAGNVFPGGASGIVHLHDGWAEIGRVVEIIQLWRWLWWHEAQLTYWCTGIWDTEIFIDAPVLQPLNRTRSGFNDWRDIRNLALRHFSGRSLFMCISGTSRAHQKACNGQSFQQSLAQVYPPSKIILVRHH